MTTAFMPASAISCSRGYRQTGSGVVSEGGTCTFPYTAPNVPITPAATPASFSMFAIIAAVVVLPLVPVTPTMRMARSGWPQNAAHARAMPSLASSTISCGHETEISRSHSTAAAPRATASAA